MTEPLLLDIEIGPVTPLLQAVDENGTDYIETYEVVLAPVILTKEKYIELITMLRQQRCTAEIKGAE